MKTAVVCRPWSVVRFYLALAALLFAFSSVVEAQQAKKTARVGYLSLQSGPPPALSAFKEGLRELGLVEGKAIEFEHRYAGGEIGKLPEPWGRTC